MSVKVTVVHGDILEQDVEAIVNSWNRNIIPWWLLLPQGVSGAIKRKAGTNPFKEVAKYGAIPLGEARFTSAGELNFKGIIHVAGINLCWFATEYSISQSVKNALNLAQQHGFKEIAMPLIGAGSGNRSADWCFQCIMKTLKDIDSPVAVRVVKYVSTR
ncbi:MULTISPECIES: macro domain-containing protein [Pseudoalteromonas]|uniref:Macro domain-containing protein n=1 Tax=Pseudoalteromonas obscura TaxID=3048491 RepID=A0ABT7EKH7_9GAMM|nr:MULTISPECIES: macro domain-containing protein [Pseudoalteromonas]MBQ4837248.1 macro domain-containing protein [Pseudoalteromonas luteoviolacea]MDK2595529.1 macro domain-containing protein [Pseudoalteromonas sp. P94(2023)]